jgi:hypothetical protein
MLQASFSRTPRPARNHELITYLEFEISNQAQRGASAFRFVNELPVENIAALWSQLQSDDLAMGRLPAEAVGADRQVQ